MNSIIPVCSPDGDVTFDIAIGTPGAWAVTVDGKSIAEWDSDGGNYLIGGQPSEADAALVNTDTNVVAQGGAYSLDCTDAVDVSETSETVAVAPPPEGGVAAGAGGTADAGNAVAGLLLVMAVFAAGFWQLFRNR